MSGFGGGNALTQARGSWLFERIVETGSVVLSVVGGDHAGTAAAHRYLASPQSSVPTVLSALRERAVAACRGRRVVAVQDTTAVSFGEAGGRHGLGPGGDGRHPGFFLHPVVAVDAQDEAVLGLVDAQIWTRGAAPVALRWNRGVSEKESRRWLVGTQAADTALAGVAEQVVSVADQEADLYEHFADHAGRAMPGSALLVRARHDRMLVEGGRMLAVSQDWPVLAREAVPIPATPGRAARTAQVTLRAGRVGLPRPRSAGPGTPAALTLGLVRVDEVGGGAAGGLCWHLLTTLPVETAAQAAEVVRLYRLRWRIEEVFRALKNDGLQLEATQMRVPSKLFRLSVLALGAAVRILQLVDARDGGMRPMSDVLDASTRPVVAALGQSRERATARQRNPHRAGSLAWLSWIVARFGGWNCYGKPPGPKIMARGWASFTAALTGALIDHTEQNLCSP